VTAGTVDAVVVGAGIIGLTTAVHLAESGLAVEVRSAAPPELSTSAAAGAMWCLSYVEESERVLEWSRHTLAQFIELGSAGAGGVRIVGGIEACRRQRVAPLSETLLPGVRPCDPSELPPGFVCGSRFDVPIVDMPVYLGHLQDRLRSAGGRLRLERVRSLEEVSATVEIVVNCAGIGASALVPDPEVDPVRGQLVIVDNPGIVEFFAEDDDDDDLLYVLPHGEKAVLGGCAERGRWDVEPDAVVAKSIIERCAEILPVLADARIIEHRVGLRPVRPRVRCEMNRRSDGGWLGHNYGHGGSGVTLSWGCARTILGSLR
jgi:D-amino-acid oxidase